ncbi:UvrABC system protein B [Striga asiatica]|uniref:UvrABC system protein B n=1 Tax=Striga asiatica TaxID=4170 RepID=A0A5A7PNZ9_STRAF|nr:UvrABC system protein B [Striga asiatica]
MREGCPPCLLLTNGYLASTKLSISHKNDPNATASSTSIVSPKTLNETASSLEASKDPYSLTLISGLPNNACVCLSIKDTASPDLIVAYLCSVSPSKYVTYDLSLYDFFSPSSLTPATSSSSGIRVPQLLFFGQRLVKSKRLFFFFFFAKALGKCAHGSFELVPLVDSPEEVPIHDRGRVQFSELDFADVDDCVEGAHGLLAKHECQVARYHLECLGSILLEGSVVRVILGIMDIRLSRNLCTIRQYMMSSSVLRRSFSFTLAILLMLKILKILRENKRKLTHRGGNPGLVMHLPPFDRPSDFEDSRAAVRQMPKVDVDGFAEFEPKAHQLRTPASKEIHLPSLLQLTKMADRNNSTPINNNNNKMGSKTFQNFTL